MLSKDIPKDLRAKIKQYLDYNWEIRKDIKIDEEDVMDLLNTELKE